MNRMLLGLAALRIKVMIQCTSFMRVHVRSSGSLRIQFVRFVEPIIKKNMDKIIFYDDDDYLIDFIKADSENSINQNI